MPATAARQAPTAQESLQEYGRGVAGGLLFSLPLLYTMEVWHTGFAASPARLLGALGCTFLLLLGYNRFAGLRQDASFREVVVDSVEELGLGIVLATLVLFLTGRFASASADEALGKIALEALMVAIGVSVGTAQLGQSEEETGMQGDEGDSVAGQLVLALCGAVLVAGNVAPTDEIVEIAIESTPGELLGLVALSLSSTAMVLQFAEFRGSRPMMRSGSLPAALFGTAVTYAVAIAASAAALWFFRRFDGMDLSVCAAQTAVLAFPGALGASAGRFLIQNR